MSQKSAGQDEPNPYVVTAVDRGGATRRCASFRARALLWAYLVHHLAALAGLVLGGAFNLDMLFWLFPIKKSLLTTVGSVICIPLMDIYLVIEPLTEEAHPSFRILQASRSMAVIIVIAAMVFYGWRRSTTVLWFIGLTSFVVYATVAYYGLGRHYSP